MEPSKAIAIELLEQRVTELERMRTSLQALNTKLTLENRKLKENYDLLQTTINAQCILDCGKSVSV